MNLHFFDLAQTPATPWKNGGGSTREIACWPEGSGMDRFGWRVSVATIDAPGPFSVFAGVDRQIMLLDGDGVHLASPGWQHRLGERWQPLAFAGDEPVHCTPLGGASTDFNLMLRRGAWQGRLQVLREAPPPASSGLCMVLQGRWHGPRQLEPGQGCWWVQADDAPSITPLAEQGAAPPVLAWIALEQCAAENSSQIGR